MLLLQINRSKKKTSRDFLILRGFSVVNDEDGDRNYCQGNELTELCDRHPKWQIEDGDNG